MIVLPTPERTREQPSESGGWSQFFDAVLAALDSEPARDPTLRRVERDVTDLHVE